MSTQDTPHSTAAADHDPEWAPTARAHIPHQRLSSSTSASHTKEPSEDKEGEEEEEDEYEKRIERTGCAAENEALQNCYSEKHDWRACQGAMIAFRECWKRNNNVEAEE